MTVVLGFGLILSAYKLFDISKFYEWNKAYIIIPGKIYKDNDMI